MKYDSVQNITHSSVGFVRFSSSDSDIGSKNTKVYRLTREQATGPVDFGLFFTKEKCFDVIKKHEEGKLPKITHSFQGTTFLIGGWAIEEETVL